MSRRKAGASEAPLRTLTRAELMKEARRLRRKLKTLKDPPAPQRDWRVIVHELEVQQEEVRIQNLQLIQSQRLLEESRDRYAELYDFAPIPYITLCANGLIRDINLTGAAMLGEMRARLIDTPFHLCLDFASKRAFLHHLHMSRTEGKPIRTEMTLHTRDHRHVPVELASSAPHTVEQGLRIRSVLIDLSEQRKAEAERSRLNSVQQSEQLLRAVLETLPMGVRVLDYNGHVIISNGAARRLLGDVALLPLKSWNLRRGWWADSGAPLGQTDWPAFHALRRGGSVLNAMIEIPDGPEGRRTIRATAVPLKDAQGCVTGAVAVDEDVTDIRRAQHEIVQAREAAERANQLKDQFLAVVSHELRTPVSAVLLWTHLLRHGNPDGTDLRTALDTIHASARSQAQLVDELLDVSRIVTGKMRLELSPHPISPIVHSAVESVLPVAQAKGLVLQQDLRDDAGAADVDPDRLRQVILNLLNNAIKFTPVGGTINVTSKRHGQDVCIAVIDSGEGIRPDFLPHVFDRFRQADSTTTRPHGGLGLGLAIAKDLVEMQGGTLRAHSQGEGCGATFTIELPVAQEPSSQQHPATPPPSETAALAPSAVPTADSLPERVRKDLHESRRRRNGDRG